MIDVINTIRQELIDSGAENIYSAFDALPVSSKGNFFTVIGSKKFECSTPVYSQFTIYIPFRTDLEIKIHAPESSSMEELCRYYNDNIKSVLDNISGLSCNVSDMSIKHDKNVCRLVLTVILSAGGMKQIERATEEQE